MNRIVVVILLIVFPGICIAQNAKRYRKPRETRKGAGYNDCSYQYRYSAKKRLGFFPFNSAASIRLISYEEGENAPIYFDEISRPPIPAEDTAEVFQAIAPNHFIVNYCRVKEIRDLSGPGLDSLTDLLYNVRRKPIKIPDDVAFPGHSCYMPLNAILFMNKEGRVLNYIEVCFQCQRYYFSSSKTQEVDFCDQKWEMLKTYFLTQGIKYGVEELEGEE